ncbi:hypothetical protein BV25DRAFT_875782 [Artomyces pyxidatus]|uniref:Uncharacterized protein n=1 Tax=Artomyces pyxidatus TaxID=48021 RepID=A0ACB8THE4_9AGAM|nr:hypothetical protein BV25DRAFT_875782 [Artomyces pyxidatus]
MSVSAPRPFVSSPLASSGPVSSAATAQPRQHRAPFPASRPLRPFASIANSFTPVSSSSPHPRDAQRSTPKKGKPVKLIQPPKNYPGTFVLNLTQAELSRQD